MKECNTVKYPEQLTPRILRDVDDGVIALDRHGHIMSILFLSIFILI